MGDILSDQWQKARTLQDLGGCLAAWHLRQLGDMPTRRTRGKNEISPEGDAASALARVCEQGCFVAYEATAGLTVERWNLVTKAEVHAFVPTSLIGPVWRALQAEDELYYSAHAPGSPSKKSSYPIELRDGKDGGWGDWVFGPNEIEDDFYGLHPQVIEELKGSWQVFVADTKWGRNSYLWSILAKLV